jgi:hypothetical protein
VPRRQIWRVLLFCLKRWTQHDDQLRTCSLTDNVYSNMKLFIWKVPQN